MSKTTLISLVALICSILAYAINDMKQFARYEEKVNAVCSDVEQLQKGTSRVPVLENRVLHLEDNTNRLIAKMDKVLDALAGGRLNNGQVRQ